MRSAECGIVAEFVHSSLKNGKTAEMQAVQGVVSTPTGVYIDVHEQGARSNNEEMRSIYVVFTLKYGIIRPLPFQDYPFCKR